MTKQTAERIIAAHDRSGWQRFLTEDLVHQILLRATVRSWSFRAHYLG